MNIERPTGVPVEGMLCDTLWSDPCKVIVILFLFIIQIMFMFSKQCPLNYPTYLILK